MTHANTAASSLALMGLDVDGVLTDGRLYFGPHGDEMKTFSSLDGHGIKMLQQAGIEVVLITGRRSRAVELRAENLGIQTVCQGVADKRSCMQQLLADRGIDARRAGYMGDDVVDLPVLRSCGFSATPGDGHPFVRAHVDYVAKAGGGNGAVREVCDFILAAQGLLDGLYAQYLA